VRYLQARRSALGGYLPLRREDFPPVRASTPDFVHQLPRRLGRTRDIDHHGFRSPALAADARQ